jgi:hypothetical protein
MGHALYGSPECDLRSKATRSSDDACSLSSGSRRTFGVRTRPRVAFIPGPTLRLFFTQKSSGTLIRSVLNEYTDFTNPDRALLSNQALAKPPPSGARQRHVGPCASLGCGIKGDRECRRH